MPPTETNLAPGHRRLPRTAQMADTAAGPVPALPARFTLGERLESGLLAVLEECVDATYSKHKRTQLNNANRRLSSVQPPVAPGL